MLPVGQFEVVSFHRLSLGVSGWQALADTCAKMVTLRRLVFQECTWLGGALTAASPESRLFRPVHLYGFDATLKGVASCRAWRQEVR
jgi:hypothetical protein